MKSHIVENCNKGNIKLTKYILDTYPNLSRNILYKALRNKDIKINNIRISKDTIIHNNDNIVIYIDDKFLYNLPEKINYLYNDENIVIAYKPQGILSNNEDSIILEPTFEDLVKKDFKDAKLCHRLDRNTAGLLIFSLNEPTFNEIKNGFQKNYISKEYIAYVSNSTFTNTHEILEKYIFKDSKNGFVKIYDNKIKGSQKIITEYTVLETNKKYDYAILSVKIPTGKTHQIRAQLKNINHPLIGDSKYGNNLINKKFNIYKQLLFAYKYTFLFNKDSFLFYLNYKKFELPKSLYIKNIGEIYEIKENR
jgi:23S rRNA pseudouridine955/2504/2580 synthase